jgi:phage terminase large subunit
MQQLVNSKYKEVFTSNSNIRYIILLGGRGAGRSTVASQYLISRLVAPEYMRCAIMRGIHSDIRHSSWKEITDRVDEQEIRNNLHITDNDMHISYLKNSIQAHGFRASSSSQSAKLKSLASYNVVWIEEAEEIGEEEFRTLDDTMRTVKGNITIILTLNPPAKSHWIIQKWFDLEEVEKGFYLPTLKKDVKDVLFINTSFLDNLANLDNHSIQKYKEYEQTNPSYYYQKIKGLVPEVVRGKIYTGWKMIDELPFEARLIKRGLDFGWFPDPMALVNIYYYNGGYILDELAFGTEIKNRTIADTIINDTQKALTVADSAEPKSIDEIKNYGVDIIGVPKEKGSVTYGIKVVSALRISVTKRSINLWKAYENYAWAEDKDGNPKGEPNHYLSDFMDATRYGLVSIVDTGTDPDKDKKQFVEILHRRNEYKKTQTRKVGL